MKFNGGKFGVGVGVIVGVAVHVPGNVAGGNVLLNMRRVGGGVVVQIKSVK